MGQVRLATLWDQRQPGDVLEVVLIEGPQSGILSVGMRRDGQVDLSSPGLLHAPVELAGPSCFDGAERQGVAAGEKCRLRCHLLLEPGSPPI